MKKARDRGMNVDAPAGDLHRPRQRGAGGQARRHDDHHPCLPRQFPLDLDRVGRLRAGGREPPRALQLRRLFPRIRHRAGGRLRAAAVPPQGQQGRGARADQLEDRRRSRRRTTSSAASTRRRNSRRSSSSRCRRNAASPRPRKATCSPRTSSGRSFAWRSRSPARCGADADAAHQAAVPRRPCGKPAAHGRPQRGAHPPRARRDRSRRACGDRGRGDRRS